MGCIKQDTNEINKVGSKEPAKNYSYGVLKSYRELRKKGWKNIIGKTITDTEFYDIIRTVNKVYSDALVRGEDIELPCRMGKLFLIKKPCFVIMKDGKVKNNKPIDWKTTLKVWKDDEEFRREKKLIRFDNDFILRMKYDKHKANYKNKSFFQFTTCRALKRRLRDAIQNNELNTFEYGRIY